MRCGPTQSLRDPGSRFVDTAIFFCGLPEKERRPIKEHLTHIAVAKLGTVRSRGRSLLTPADRYRAYAAQCRAKANNESNDRAKGDWEALAQDYMRLAKQAEANDKFDVVYETTLLTSRWPRARH